MSVLLLGVSHRSAPIEILEKVAVADSDRPKLTDRLLAEDHVCEAMIVSTCNRVEVYAVVDAFHAGLAEVGALLAEHAELPLAQLTRHAYVRYSEAAAEHLFAVAGGLDSLVVGEQQVLGQIRAAYAAADAQQAAGRTLHELAQHALRVGKRVHAETGIDAAGSSVVSVALDRARSALAEVQGRVAVVVGAGAMAALSVAQLARAQVSQIVVVNRTLARAQRLAQTAETVHGVPATAADLSSLVAALAAADIVLTSTGAVGSVVTLADMHRALATRAGRPLVICDLGLPRDVDPAVAGLPDVTVIDMQTLQRDPSAGAAAADTIAARTIIAEELEKYLAGQRMAAVTPTVAALRQRAAEVVEAELLRLQSRVPGLADDQRDEVAWTVRRVVDKLLHTPTVRVKQLASTPGGANYAEALRELFELQPGAAEAVAAPSAAKTAGAEHFRAGKTSPQDFPAGNNDEAHNR